MVILSLLGTWANVLLWC